MREIIQEKVKTIILENLKEKYIIAGVGLATFLFGFGAGAVLNFYLLFTHSTLFGNLRTTLDYKSSIFGDGIVLPIINMFAAYFVLRNKEFLRKKVIRNAIFLGLLTTIYFHINQAARGLVNWAMPTPWHWNILGSLHAAYMFLTASFVGLFYLVAIKYIRKNKSIPKEVLVVTAGAIIFLILLRLDYISVNLSLPRF